MIVKVYKRYWWPHPYSRPYLWRKVVVGYRYYVETDLLGNPLEDRP